MEPLFLPTDRLVDPFKVQDKFNPGNEIEGYIYKQANMKYGMLHIIKVNGRPAEQFIYATPKMHYPFGKDGTYQFAENISSIEVYEKLDGTNILAYIYRDADKNTFVTYKTRLRPNLEDGKFGRFQTLWREILDIYPKLPDFCLTQDANFSFELFGKRNKVLIEYDHSLDANILFLRSRIDGSVFSPSSFHVGTYGLKVVPLITAIDGSSNLTEEYAKVTQYLNEHIKVTQGQEGQADLVQGMEGSVWYALSGDRTIQYKCKPDYVRDIHFAAGAGIPKHSIFTTCVNAFEDRENPDVAYIKQLLLEEFQESEIEKKAITIEKILASVRFDMRMKSEVVEEYLKHPEFNIAKDRGLVMRYFSTKYDKGAAGKVFKLLFDEFGGK